MFACDYANLESQNFHNQIFIQYSVCSTHQELCEESCQLPTYLTLVNFSYFSANVDLFHTNPTVVFYSVYFMLFNLVHF